MAAAMERVRSDLFLRPRTRSVVLAHAFVGGGVASESERERVRPCCQPLRACRPVPVSSSGCHLADQGNDVAHKVMDLLQVVVERTDVERIGACLLQR